MTARGSQLSVGRMRRDTVSTTVTRRGNNGYDETRRVVAHTLSHAHVEEIERATGPVQLPVGTRVDLEQAVHTAHTVFELDRSW